MIFEVVSGESKDGHHALDSIFITGCDDGKKIKLHFAELPRSSHLFQPGISRAV